MGCVGRARVSVGGMGCSRCGWWRCVRGGGLRLIIAAAAAAAIEKLPRNLEFANTEGVKVQEKTLAEIQAAVATPGTLIHNGGNGTLTTCCNQNRFEALRSRGASAILWGVQRNDEVVGAVIYSTSAHTISIVCGMPSKPLLEMARNLLMVGLMVGFACDKGGTKDGRNEGCNDFHSERTSDREPCRYN